MSEEKNLSGVADTLFIPLTARIEVSKRFPEFFYDEKAMELSEHEAVKKIKKKSSEYSVLASVARSYDMDCFVNNFVKENGESAVVCLGVGLETMNFRLKDCSAHFYCVDFPEVIEKRRQFLSEEENETIIACDIKDLAWTEQVNKTLPVLLIVSGVFQYFRPEEVIDLLQELKGIFPGGEMFFDAINEVGVRYASKYVKKTGNTSAMMYFYINDPQKFADEAGVQLLGVSHFFDDARRVLGKKLGLYSRIAMKVADEKNRTFLVHIRL